MTFWKFPECNLGGAGNAHEPLMHFISVLWILSWDGTILLCINLFQFYCLLFSKHFTLSCAIIPSPTPPVEINDVNGINTELTSHFYTLFLRKRSFIKRKQRKPKQFSFCAPSLLRLYKRNILHGPQQWPRALKNAKYTKSEFTYHAGCIYLVCK